MLEISLSSHDGKRDEDEKRRNSETRGLIPEVKKDPFFLEGQQNYHEKEYCLLEDNGKYFCYLYVGICSRP
jgi:hypothetical protein